MVSTLPQCISIVEKDSHDTVDLTLELGINTELRSTSLPEEDVNDMTAPINKTQAMNDIETSVTYTSEDNLGSTGSDDFDSDEVLDVACDLDNDDSVQGVIGKPDKPRKMKKGKLRGILEEDEDFSDDSEDYADEDIEMESIDKGKQLLFVDIDDQDIPLSLSVDKDERRKLP